MSRIEITKKLLSEVLDINDIIHVQKEGSCSIFISRANNPAYIINIYEFAFKCKEWAKTKKMYINSIYNEFYWDRIEKEYFADIPNKNKSFYADTEVEAIIKACQWILKEIKDK